MNNTHASYDVVVVGGGASGMMSAYCLALRGYKVLILEKNTRLGEKVRISGVTGGKPELIETIAKAAIAVGTDGLFLETHPNPSQAKSDGANMLPLAQLPDLLDKLLRIRAAIQ